MQAISVPTPDEPPARTPFGGGQPGTGSTRHRAQWLTALGAAIAVFALGWVIGAGAEPTEGPPDRDTMLAWMFDAALAHEATTPEGDRQPPAVGTVRVDRVDTVDPTTGPLLAIVTLDERRSAYTIVIERTGVDWTVEARRMTDRGAISRAGS